MRILRIINSMDPTQGGPMQGVRTSIATIKSLGVDCENEVVCLDDPDASYCHDDGIAFHALGETKGPWQRSPALLPWLRANLHRFDAVIIHGLWLYYSYAATKAAGALGQRRPRVFVMPHGMLDPWFQKHPSRRVKAIRNWFYWKLIEQRTIAQADGLLFTCQKELKLARTTFRPYRPRRELNVGYGVAAPPPFHEGMRSAFRERVPGLGDRPYLLFLSRVHPKKGVDLLIKAYAKQAGQRAQAGIATPDLVIAGPLDSKYAESMKELAHREMAPREMTGQAKPGESEKPPEIHFPGMLSGDSKWAAFYGCEAFLLPSHQENFGIAVVEALACGRPVLISDQVNIGDEIEQSGAGFVDRDDDAGTRALLERFFALNDEAKATMSVSATECYAANFSPETAALRLLEAISPEGSGADLPSEPQ